MARRSAIVVLALVALVASGIASLALGAEKVPAKDVISIVFGDSPESRETHTLLTATPEDAEAALEMVERGRGSDQAWFRAAERYAIDKEERLDAGGTELLTEGSLDENLESAVFGAEPQELLGPIPADGGYYVAQVEQVEEEGPFEKIVLDLRVPSLIEALLVGAALAVAGVVLQGALGNPLASPDVIGVTAGAGFGATLILLAFPEQAPLLPIGALAFGLLAAALVFGIAWTGQNRGGVARVILAGIAIAALFAAGTTSLLTAFPDRVQSVIFFLAGGLTPSGWTDLENFWPYFTAGFVIAAFLIRPLDRLSLGDDVAASLGSRPGRIRLVSGLSAALLASAAAALVGLLAFLGLVIPHLVRMAGGTARHAFVLPVSAITGAALLTGGDVLARTVAAPTVLPVGPFMVVLGVPLFLWLLRKAT